MSTNLDCVVDSVLVVEKHIKLPRMTSFIDGQSYCLLPQEMVYDLKKAAKLLDTWYNRKVIPSEFGDLITFRQWSPTLNLPTVDWDYVDSPKYREPLSHIVHYLKFILDKYNLPFKDVDNYWEDLFHAGLHNLSIPGQKKYTEVFPKPKKLESLRLEVTFSQIPSFRLVQSQQGIPMQFFIEHVRSLYEPREVLDEKVKMAIRRKLYYVYKDGLKTLQNVPNNQRFTRIIKELAAHTFECAIWYDEDINHLLTAFANYVNTPTYKRSSTVYNRVRSTLSQYVTNLEERLSLKEKEYIQLGSALSSTKFFAGL